MGVFDKASLALVPDGIKDGKLYSIKPTDGSGDFTFTRGSNLAATRVDENGLIEKGRENLLLQSNAFNGSEWTKGNFSFLENQADKDGGTTAWKATCSTNYNYLGQNVSGNGVYTFSGYFRKGDSNEGVRFNFSATTDTNVYIDLTDGSSTDNGNLIYKSITAAGNGFYKVVVSANISSLAIVRFFITNGDTTQVSGNIYIQDAQLEQGLVATDYIETGATTVQAGILEDLPRIDYTGGTPSLLLEPSRTNLVEYSEYITQSELSAYGTDVSHNATQSPSGKNSAALVYEESSTSSHYLLKGVTTTSSTTYTQSAFVKKKDSGIYASLRTNGVSGNSYIIFDFDTATIVDEGSDIISSGVVDYSNGWYRIHMTYTLATISFIAGITNSTTNPIASYLGTGKGYYIWGLQLEQGSYPTSYIPTYGAIATRGEDGFEKTGISSLIGQTEGTIFFEFDYSHQFINQPFFNIREDANNTYQIIALSTFGLRFRARVSNTFYGAISTPSAVNEGIHKAAMIYKSGGYKFYLDGTLIGTSTDSQIVSNPSEIEYYMDNNNLKQFLVFPEALSDAECITLTT